MSKKAMAMAARYGRKSDILEIVQEIIDETYHVSAFNRPLYPIVTADASAQVFNWGLVPYWTKTVADAEKISGMTFNAVSETVFEKPSFRHAIVTGRCLVPSTGYFEWRHEAGNKIPYFIHLKDEEIFSLAGIYESWRNPETGKEIQSFSILTTEANPMMQYIHNTKKRMPAILDRAEEEAWLNPNLKPSDIAAFLRPFDEKRMDAYVIQSDFLKKNPHDPSIIQAVA